MLWNKKIEPALPATAAFDVARMSYLDLRELRDRVNAEMARQFEQARESFQRDFLVKMQEFGLSLDDFKPKRKKRTRTVKFRDPANPDNVWSGLGRPKKWLQEQLDAGRTLEEFSVE